MFVELSAVVAPAVDTVVVIFLGVSFIGIKMLLYRAFYLVEDTLSVIHRIGICLYIYQRVHHLEQHTVMLRSFFIVHDRLHCFIVLHRNSIICADLLKDIPLRLSERTCYVERIIGKRLAHYFLIYSRQRIGKFMLFLYPYPSYLFQFLNGNEFEVCKLLRTISVDIKLYLEQSFQPRFALATDIRTVVEPARAALEIAAHPPEITALSVPVL